MKQRLLIITLFLVLLASYFFVCLPFFESKPSNSYKSPTPLDERALIWKIEGNGLAKPSYIMGTMHTQCPEIVNHIEGWEEASTQCEMVVSESTYQELKFAIDSMSARNNLLVGELLCDSSLLHQLMVDPKQWNGVYTAFQIETIKSIDTTLLHLQPFMAIYRIKQSINATAERQQLYPQRHRVDTLRHLMDYFILKRIHEERGLLNVALDDSVCGLSLSTKSLSEILAQTDFEKTFIEDANLLLKYIEKRNEIVNGLKVFDSIYYFHDPYRFDKVCRKSAQTYPDYVAQISDVEDSLTYAVRNEKWMKKIPQYMEEKSCLIMVGAGHLVKTQSDRGLIQRLREMNYTLTPYLYKDGND